MEKKLKNILVFGLLLYGAPLHGQSNYIMAGDHSFIIRGSSNIRDWSESANDADGIASISITDEKHFDIDEVRILIRANQIKSMDVEGNVMNKKIYETLKAGQYPTITFIVISTARSVAMDGEKHFIEARGILKIAGVSRIIRLHPAISAEEPEKINIEGDAFLKMSDFDIKPPFALFGLLRVNDDLTVHFKISLIPDFN